MNTLETLVYLEDELTADNDKYYQANGFVNQRLVKLIEKIREAIKGNNVC